MKTATMFLLFACMAATSSADECQDFALSPTISHEATFYTLPNQIGANGGSVWLSTGGHDLVQCFAHSADGGFVNVGFFGVDNHTYHGDIIDMVRVGDTAYIAFGYGGVIGPGGFNTYPNAARSLCVVGERLYVVSYQASWLQGYLTVRDIAGNATLGTYTLPTAAEYVAVKDSVAYVSTDPIQIIDCTNPAQMTAIGTLPISGRIKVYGNFAYVAASDRFYVVDVANPRQPIITGSVPVPGIYGFDVENGLAYLLAGGTIYVIDVRYSSFPVVYGTLSNNGGSAGIDVSDGWIYTASRDGYGQVKASRVQCPIPRSPVPLNVTDIDSDQGGRLSVSWPRFFEETLSGDEALTTYNLQRWSAGTWTTIASATPNMSDSYVVEVQTPDVFTVGAPEPWSRYRVVAHTPNPDSFYTSAVDSGYSVDNLGPPPATATLFSGESYIAVVANDPNISDFGEMVVYRGTYSGFALSEPIARLQGLQYLETQLNNFYYRVAFVDIHGNIGSTSEELHIQNVAALARDAATALKLHPASPNPFNPCTTFRYELPESGPVRLDVFDLAGHLVRTLVDESNALGSHVAVWDGRDAAGREVGSGTYLGRLEFGDKVETIAVGLVR